MNLASVIEPHPDGAPALVSRGKVTTYGELRRQAGGAAGAGWSTSGSSRATGWRSCRPTTGSSSSATWPSSASAPSPCPSTRPARRPSSPPSCGRSRPRPRIVGPSSRLAAEGIDAPPWASRPHRHRAGALAGRATLESLFPGGRAPIVDRDDSDLAALLFTAGTAGAPKAAMLSHGNLLANIDQIQTAPGPGAHVRRHRARRAPDAPHLRAQRRARAVAGGRRVGRARRAVRPVERPGDHRQPQGDDRGRRAAHVHRRGWRCPRADRCRRDAHRPPRRVRRGRARASVTAAFRVALRRRRSTRATA